MIEKSRENEEQVYSEHSRLRGEHDGPGGSREVEPIIFRSKPMEKQHAENGNPAQRVQLGHEAPNQRFRRKRL